MTSHRRLRVAAALTKAAFEKKIENMNARDRAKILEAWIAEMAALKDDHKPYETPLAQRMRELADGGKHPRAVELFARARELDSAAINPVGTGVKKLLGAWARARRLYCDITGEELV